MEPFIGTWKLIKDEDYDKYLRGTGAGEELIAVSNVLKPLITISQDDDIVEIKIQSGIGTEEVIFQLGREFHRQHKDGRYCKVVVELEEDKLIKVEKWENANATSIIEVKDGKLIQTIKFGEINAVRTFERV